jgi:hypothetical protein
MTAIYEICADTICAGKIPAVMSYEEMSGSGSSGPIPFGIFATMFGPVNQVQRICKHASFDAFAETRGGRAQPGICDHVLLRERSLLWPERDVTEAASGYALYELRTYDTRIGSVGELTRLLTENISIRERYSPNFGIWTPLAGPIERIVHLWAYRNYEHRAAVQVQSRKDPEWLSYLEKARPLITTMSAVVMTPLPGSSLA